MAILFSHLVFYSGFSFLFQATFLSSPRGTSSEGAAQVMTVSLMLPTQSIITASIKTTLSLKRRLQMHAYQDFYVCMCLCVRLQQQQKITNCDCIGNICKSGEPQKLKESMGQWNADIPGTTSLSRVMFMDKLLNMYSTDYEMWLRMTVLYFP